MKTNEAGAASAKTAVRTDPMTRPVMHSDYAPRFAIVVKDMKPFFASQTVGDLGDSVLAASALIAHTTAESESESQRMLETLTGAVFRPAAIAWFEKNGMDKPHPINVSKLATVFGADVMAEMLKRESLTFGDLQVIFQGALDQAEIRSNSTQK